MSSELFDDVEEATRLADGASAIVAEMSENHKKLPGRGRAGEG